jgi:hypothetical protein
MAVFAAAGAITFVAADGHSNMRRLIVGLSTTGSNCNGFGDGTNIVGTGQAFDAWGGLVCDVNATANSGSTVYATQRCNSDPINVPNTPVYTWGLVRRINVSTGDVHTPICSAASWSWWPSSSTCSQSYNGCTFDVNAWGVQ